MSRKAEDSPNDDERREYAFHMEPQLAANGDSWKESNPPFRNLEDLKRIGLHQRIFG